MIHHLRKKDTMIHVIHPKAYINGYRQRKAFIIFEEITNLEFSNLEVLVTPDGPYRMKRILINTRSSCNILFHEC